MKLGDGTLGWAAQAPFDGMLVTAGGPEIPKHLLAQLKIGGRLVIPVGKLNTQKMMLVHRLSETEYKTEDKGRFKFVPLIGKEGWPGK